MDRRTVLIAIGGTGVLGGSGVIAGGSLYGSSDLEFESTDDAAVVRKDGERVDAISQPVTPVQDDDAILGISLPDRATVARVAVEVVWAIRRDGLWSDITLELSSTGDISAPLDPGVATAYSSPWGRSASVAEGSTASRRRYAYPRGTTAGHASTALSVQADSDAAGGVVGLEARLSARSVGGTRVELTAPAELTYSPD